MRAKLLLSALAVSAALTAHADYLFSTQFNSTQLPEGMTNTVGENSPTVIAADYRQGYNADAPGWTVIQPTVAYVYSAVCASHTESETPMDATLSTPEIAISGTAPMLRWVARSMYPIFPEAFKVTVLEAGATEPVIVFETDNTPGKWTNYAVDLSKYIGKTVTVNFVCTSVNKYMLALDNIYIGDPEDSLFACDVNAPAYVGNENETMPVTGTVTNFGKLIEGGKIVLTCGTDTQEFDLPETWGCGETADFEFSIPVTLGESTAYTISIKDADGVTTKLAEKSTFCSYFTRLLSTTEYTGLWCNNCPGAQFDMDDLRNQFGDNIVISALHQQPDMFICEDYFNVFRTYAAPWFVLNQIMASGSGYPRYFDKYYEDHTIVKIDISDFEINGDKLTVKTNVKWADENNGNIDNSDDRYRIGYILTRSIHPAAGISEIKQVNGVNGVKYERYNILPKNIPSDLVDLEDVIIGTDAKVIDLQNKVFSYGLENLLPETMIPGQEYESSFTITKPEVAEKITWPSARDFELKDCRIVAYVTDANDAGKILNATVQYLNEEVPPTVAIKDINTDSMTDLNAEPVYYNLQGIRVVNPDKGIYLKRQGTKVTKIAK
ncbi:MAG: choice-of-anchor J domain-containing protein [Prevotella sp.]|nr:choice-of-anchor J domain-containing protein [Prevotella sp.]MCM1075680.1 choice-of-anchor J domain-containing protein [Ruminococcus sp.]